jgi:hypothetical protein
MLRRLWRLGRQPERHTKRGLKWLAKIKNWEEISFGERNE